MYRLKLKRKYLVIVTIILTLISVKTIDLIIKTSITENKKTIEECEQQFNHSCNSSELNYFYKNVK